MAKDSDSSSDIKKMEAIIDRGVRLKKGIAMGGMDNPSAVEHRAGGKGPKLPNAKAAAKGNKSAY